MEDCFQTPPDNMATLEGDADCVMQNYFPGSTTFFEENWKVERIVAVTEKDGVRFYKVKWSKCIWQSEESLQPIQQLLHTFWEEHSNLTLSSDSTAEEKSNTLLEESAFSNVLFRNPNDVEVESGDKTYEMKMNSTSQESFTEMKLQSSETNMEADTNETDIAENDPENENGDSTSANVDLSFEQPFSMSCPVKEKLFRCDVCNKSFDRKTSLQRHSLIHSGEKPWHCRICSKSFNQNSILQRHLLTHAHHKSFQCDICQKMFTEKAALNRHRAVHSSEKLWNCNVCDKKFILKEYLAKHMFLHTGCKPHKCQSCERSFADSCALRRHQKVHENEKNHVCELCRKVFKSLSSLNKHFLRCRNLCCLICESQFKIEKHCTEHLKTHSTPYKCKRCASEFEDYKKLLTHVQSHFSFNKPLKCDAGPNEMFSSCKELDDHITKLHRYKQQPDLLQTPTVFDESNVKRLNDVVSVDKNSMKVPKSFDELFKSALLP